ncbi:oligosaccharide flippase family protein [Clostridium sp. DL1XJH146]
MTDNSKLKFAIKNGFIHIFSANFLNKIVQFASSLVLVRILSTKNYGDYSYALTALNMFLLLQGIGVVPAVLQYCSEKTNYEDKYKYLKFALKLGVLANSTISLAILIYTSFFKLPVVDSTEILRAFFFFPIILILFELISIFFRTELKNREFSFLTSSNTILFFLFTFILGLFFGLKGVIIARYLAYSITLIIAFYLSRIYIIPLWKASKLEKTEKISFTKYALTCSFTNAISQLLLLLDTFLVGLITKDSMSVGVYRNATLVPFNLLFIPGSIMIFVYPYFAKNNYDKKWIRENYIKLEKYLFLFNLTISTILIIGAKPFILLLFGSDYLDSIVPFRILMFGYIIAGSFRSPAGNILASIKKVRVNFYNAIISGIANIILDVVLILKFGSNGAAIATVSVFIISSLISNVYLYKYLK